MGKTDDCVMIVDDDAELGKMLVEYLARFELTAQHYENPKDALSAFDADTHKVVTVDVMMPGMDGVSMCRKLREYSAVPIIMLTALGETPDKVVGFEAGADDYLAKPFEPRELVARIQALLRRGAGEMVQANMENLQIDQRKGRALMRDDKGDFKDLMLTDTEFAVLVELVKHRPQPVTRDKLFALMRGFERDVTDRSIDILISRLRQKMGDDPYRPRHIRTVRLTGYAYVG